MKRTMSLLSAALLGTTILTAPVLAESLNTQAGAKVGVDSAAGASANQKWKAGADADANAAADMKSQDGALNAGAKMDANGNASTDSSSGSVTTGANMGADDSAAEQRATAETGVRNAVEAEAANGAAEAATGVDMTATGSVDASANDQGEVISAIRGENAAAAEISGATNLANVEIVRLDSASEESMKAINKAVEDNQQTVGDLRAVIGANSALKTKLSAEGIDTSAVVAARSGADGALKIYVR